MRTLTRGHRVGREGVPGRGFTLIELLVAIVIISALIALLLPAVQSSIATSRRAQVQAEISRLGSALADFKAKFGIYPPSSITLFEAADANLTDGAGWDSDPRSMGLIRQLWPQFDFNAPHNFNGDNDATDVLDLSKGECLVFFLGGMPNSEDKDSDGVLDAGEDLPPVNGIIDTLPGVVGFSQNPSNPFLRSGSNRVGPFFEFDISRFTDMENDTMAEFRDTLPGQSAPYLYFSAYDGQGYLASETAPQLATVYLQGTAAAWNPQTFQIISPGDDGRYGGNRLLPVVGPVGDGLFNPDTASEILVRQDMNGDLDTNDTDPPNDWGDEWREPERDNITNFHQGPLAPN